MTLEELDVFRKKLKVNDKIFCKSDYCGLEGGKYYLIHDIRECTVEGCSRVYVVLNFLLFI